MVSARLITRVAFWIALPSCFSGSPLLGQDGSVFSKTIQPLLQEYCQSCHKEDKPESGVRVDGLLASFPDDQLFLWKDILKQLVDENMPPDGERKPTRQQRDQLIQSIRDEMKAAQARNKSKNGSVRRLTISQYGQTLRDLLGINDNVAQILPPDGISKDGFSNNGQLMGLTPLQLEYYVEIADKALELCIVDENTKPVVQNFRMVLGENTNPSPLSDKLILGANNHLLKNKDFVVSEPIPHKAFAFEPFRMRTAYDFIEGYAGNDTVRAWRSYDSIYHSVFACMRGTEGYPKGEAYQMHANGLLLRPAIPSSEIWEQSSTYGPRANFKISLRELPERGNFRVKVKAAKFDDALLLDDEAKTLHNDAGSITVPPDPSISNACEEVELLSEGIYQIDLSYSRRDRSDEALGNEKRASRDESLWSITLNGQRFSRQPKPETKDASVGNSSTSPMSVAFLRMRLPQGKLAWHASLGPRFNLVQATFTKVIESSDAGREFLAFEKRAPWLGVHLGLRRDCGSTLEQVGEPQKVSENQFKEYVFEGAVANYPSPFVEKDNVNYLAGIRELGVRHEYTDGRDMPRLLVQSVEFEGPFYSEWPPRHHRNIFIDSPNSNDDSRYASEIIRSFMSKAYRRPVTDAEHAKIAKIWSESFAINNDFRRGIKDALLVVLTSPQFLFLVEQSQSPEPEDLEPFELASKLAYFLWNAPPDPHLLELAGDGKLIERLDSQFDRMVEDNQSFRFAREFSAQWLGLEKFESVDIDEGAYPRLTVHTRRQLQKEPAYFLHYLIQNNLPLRNIIQSDFVMANDCVASYYGLTERAESGFDFVRLEHDRRHLGGFLSQASVLSGLSNGRESNPIKRGAWFAKRIIAEPPDDPPPNVPELASEDSNRLSLRERLEIHRNQKNCVKCHSGIDPWGVVFEGFDAGGILKTKVVDCGSRLPDGTQVQNFSEFREYLVLNRMERIAFSFLKHMATYATGRTLSYNEVEFLEKTAASWPDREYRVRDLIRFVVYSDLFLKK